MRLRRRPTALLVDCDGVLRQYDPSWPLRVEDKHGLRPGILTAAAFAASFVTPAVLGETSHDAWMAAVADAVGSPEAVAEWQTDHGEIDPLVRDLVADARAAGVRVGLATNATDRLAADLASFGLTDAFDVVLNSSVLGTAKPHPEYFATACAALDAVPAEVLLLDDSARFVAGARAAGLLAHRYAGDPDVRYVRAALGLTP